MFVETRFITSFVYVKRIILRSHARSSMALACAAVPSGWNERMCLFLFCIGQPRRLKPCYSTCYSATIHYSMICYFSISCGGSCARNMSVVKFRY